MGKNTAPSEERLRQLEQRQGTPKWGSQYKPAILATRNEAPRGSRPCRILSGKIGRDMHVLSNPERDLLILALYHPDLFDLHEQKVLSCLESPHPLQGHPKAHGLKLPAMRGTILVAQALGLISQHAVIKVADPDDPNVKLTVAFPWIGDFLLFMEDQQGLYCTNWTIKAEASQFNTPFESKRQSRHTFKAIEKLEARHKIEEVYYADAAIRTVRIAGDEYNNDVANNLIQLFLWHKRPTYFDIDDTKRITDHFRAGMAVGEPPIGTITALRMDYRCQTDVLKAVLYQAIWERRLRVDLFEPVLVDRPLIPEKRDILVEYQHWFARG